MAAKRVGLAQRRKSAGYSQEKLAERLGVERSTVVRWETAESEPQPWVRPKLAAALGVTPSELQVLLDDITVVPARPSERMSYVLEHPASVDLVAVAYLHERIRQFDEQYHENLIRQGKLDEAEATMYRTIEAVELTRGGGGLNLAFAAGRELRPSGHAPWVQDVNDRLLALMAAI